VVEAVDYAMAVLMSLVATSPPIVLQQLLEALWHADSINLYTAS
jgi:hypothetical protein